jgi:hypothetical protein
VSSELAGIGYGGALMHENRMGEALIGAVGTGILTRWFSEGRATGGRCAAAAQHLRDSVATAAHNGGWLA